MSRDTHFLGFLGLRVFSTWRDMSHDERKLTINAKQSLVATLGGVPSRMPAVLPMASRADRPQT
jgi:hypothetical protein